MTSPASASSSWLRWLWPALCLLALVATVRNDLRHLQWAAQLSDEGSPPPALSTESATGYALAQRHFLGTHLRGETYRWIAAQQAGLAGEDLRGQPYLGDTLPTGRPFLLPRLYSAWLGVVRTAIEVTTGAPSPLAAEQAALWAPVWTHALALLLWIAWLWRRLGAPAAALGAVFFALYPPLCGQFIPGALTADTCAFLLASAAVLFALPQPRRPSAPATSIGGAIAAAFAVWLNPAFGVPAILLVGFTAVLRRSAADHAEPLLRWALIGAVLVGVGWLLDGAPWDPMAGELRTVHPLYALAWLGLGLVLRGGRRFGGPGTGRRWGWIEGLIGLALIAPLVVTQVRHGFPGWLHTGVELGRLTSLDETVRFPNVFAWLGAAGAGESFFVLAPIGAASLALLLALIRRPVDRAALLPVAVLFGGVLLLFIFKLRWALVAVLVAIPVLWQMAGAFPQLWRRAALAASAVFCFLLAAWSQNLPSTLYRPAGELVPRAVDLEAMVFRHFSHWLASHTPGAEVRVLAPPALSDSVVFHGDGHVLMSTAWESHPGLVAASRVLSSPESTEAEAVIESLGLTHLVITSWDPVFPLMVKAPLEDERDTLYDRLQRWVLPRYLRPIPYQLPGTPGYEAQKLAVFAVVPPQDEALALARLAEYFVEVGRPEPAGLVARTLVEDFSRDPNAAMARAAVYEQARYDSGFRAELDFLAQNIADGIVPLDWDRRVVRATMLALGKRHDLARPEIVACLATMNEEDLRQLTPLQAFRLGKLLEIYQLEFPSPDLAALNHALSSEYQP